MKTLKSQYKTNFLFCDCEKLVPVNIAQVAYFKVNEASSEAGLLDGRTYHHNFKLNDLASVLDTSQFYRASRQYLININAIRHIERYEERKLLVHFNEPCREKVVVSKEKSSDFLNWLQAR